MRSALTPSSSRSRVARTTSSWPRSRPAQPRPLRRRCMGGSARRSRRSGKSGKARGSSPLSPTVRSDLWRRRAGTTLVPKQSRGASIPRVLTIAGSDSGGGAGIQADLRTFAALGVWGTSAITSITVQNTLGVSDVADVPSRVVAAQIRAVATDIGVDAAKTGMLSSVAIVAAVADACADVEIANLVVDPVFVSKHGHPLLRPEAVEALRRRILPLATLVTPNLQEASGLARFEVSDRDDMPKAAAA